MCSFYKKLIPSKHAMPKSRFWLTQEKKSPVAEAGHFVAKTRWRVRRSDGEATDYDAAGARSHGRSRVARSLSIFFTGHATSHRPISARGIRSLPVASRACRNKPLKIWSQTGTASRSPDMMCPRRHLTVLRSQKPKSCIRQCCEKVGRRSHPQWFSCGSICQEELPPV